MEMTFTLEEIDKAASEFWEGRGDKKIFAFYGKMGAGKTTFIHALCDEKKVTGTVTSPTFSIINEYDFDGGRIFHIDLYRLKDEEEAVRAGVEDCLYSGDICLVEWAEKMPHLFPEGTVKVFLRAIDDRIREVVVG